MSLIACTFGFHKFVLQVSAYEQQAKDTKGNSEQYIKSPSLRTCDCCGMIQTKVIGMVTTRQHIHHSEYWHTTKLGNTIF